MLKYLKFIFCIFICYNSFAQKEYSNKEDIFKIDSIHFYGYDFSAFKLAEAKRLTEPLKEYIYGWQDYCIIKITPKHLARWLRKDTVVYDFKPTNEINEKIDSKSIASALRHKIDESKLPGMIKKYELAEKEGIGLVLILECFLKDEEKSSGHFVFFDIASKNILKTYYVNVYEAGGIGLKKFWGSALIVLFKEFIDKNYLPDRKNFIKKNK